MSDKLQKCQKLMGFFKYDLFPYVVAFEIAGIRDNGDFVIKDVGIFHPKSLVALRPIESGREIVKSLEKLKAEYWGKHTALNDLMTGEVAALLGIDFSCLKK